MWIKICANTSFEDALRAAELGADAVGFVFAPSSRQVSPEQVRAIARELPEGVERIGVFVGGSAQEIVSTAHTAQLTGVQLHGRFDAALLDELGRRMPELTVIPVVHWDVGDGGAVTVAFGSLAGDVPGRRVLVDAKVGATSGGLGVAFDWNSARDLFETERNRGLRLVLAGGLSPENVVGAIRMLTPWGVDVVSGVEREPGRKDFDKLRCFIENVRGA